MALGKKTGGRKKGSRNKATESNRSIAKASGTTPLAYMLEIMAQDIPKDADLNVQIAIRSMRFEAAKAAAPYVHPRLSSQVVRGPGEDGEHRMVLKLDAPWIEKIAKARGWA